MPNLLPWDSRIPDPGASNLCQGFLCQGLITALAARALIFIEADNLNIKLMCFIAVRDGRGIDVPEYRQKRRQDREGH